MSRVYRKTREGTFVSAHGETKFYKGSGRLSDRNVDTWEDKKQEKLIQKWIDSKPQKEPKKIPLKFTVKEIIAMLEKADIPLYDDQIELLEKKGYKNAASRG